jgi:hypothetical protein
MDSLRHQFFTRTTIPLNHDVGTRWRHALDKPVYFQHRRRTPYELIEGRFRTAAGGKHGGAGESPLDRVQTIEKLARFDRLDEKISCPGT